MRPSPFGGRLAARRCGLSGRRFDATAFRRRLRRRSCSSGIGCFTAAGVAGWLRHVLSRKPGIPGVTVGFGAGSARPGASSGGTAIGVTSGNRAADGAGSPDTGSSAATSAAGVSAVALRGRFHRRRLG